VPKAVAASSREQHLQTKFYQACALPSRLVEAIYVADIQRRLVRSLSQWRLDFPLPQEAELLPGLREVLAVVEALLTRGATPYCSPTVETGLQPILNDAGPIDSLDQALRHVVLHPSCEFVPLHFDSDEEASLEAWIRAHRHSDSLTWHVIPQVHLASLSSGFEPSGNERGDLLLTHPDLEPVLVEIDGAAHRGHQQRDESRDSRLAATGIPVLRVPAAEVRAQAGPRLEELHRLLLAGRSEGMREDNLILVLRLSKLVHQIELALLEAVRGGRLQPGKVWHISVVLPAKLRHDVRAQEFPALAVRDFVDLLEHVAELQGLSLPLAEPRVSVTDGPIAGQDLVIGPANGDMDDCHWDSRALFLVSDTCFPGEITAPLSAAAPIRVESPSRDVARWFLHYVFRKDDFWEGQWEAVKRSLQGKDSVVLLPTGGGKSIAFQLAALLLPGRCIVVDPILSLIDDQVDNLGRVGIDRSVGITSQIRSPEERERIIQAFSSGHYLFCYVAPERFQIVQFREALRALTASTPVSLIAVDEAHCVSEWGHDFRTAYLNLGRVSREYCASHIVTPPLIALTGTASKIVLKDVQRELGITEFDAVITPASFDRPELRYSVLQCSSSEKAHRAEGFLARLPTDFAIAPASFFQPRGEQTCAGLVFCPHVNGYFGVVQQAEHLGRALGTTVQFYSGGAPHNFDEREWNERKRETARRFKHNSAPILACTSAFGMGIDKPNIRYTVHIGLPDSIEAFYQEAGRAGRDRKKAECALILSNDDQARTERLLSPTTPVSEIARVVGETERDDEDDIMRALWFHVNSFRGQEEELRDITRVIDRLGELGHRRQVRIAWSDKGRGQPDDAARERTEKALHRLVVLGVVADYTVEYSANEFTVTLSGASRNDIARAFGAYVGSYQRRLGEQAQSDALGLERASEHREYVLGVAELLVDFTYKHIELARRSSLNEMLLAASSARTGEDLRQRILEYLEQSEYDERLSDVLTSPLGGADALTPLLDDLVSPTHAATLRGSVARLLGSYPDVPGLLLLRSITEALASDTDPEVVRQNLEAALRFATEKYKLEPSVVAQACGQVISVATRKDAAADLLLRTVLAVASVDRVFVREMMLNLPIEVAEAPAVWLNNGLAARLAESRHATGG
jgi:ATP-dependent DNA helicase RecQ